MRRLLVGMIAASLLALSALPAAAGGPPAGVGERGKPAGIACQQFGIGVLQSQGLLSSVAKDGLNFPIGSDTFIPFSTVLEIHRTDPATANAVLTAYALELGIADDDVVEALNAACPTG